LDEFGRYREDQPDTNGVSDGKITDADPVITFTSNKDTGETLASRSRARGQFTEANPFDTNIKPEDLNTVWSVHKELAKLTDLKTNRPYSTVVGAGEKKGRYIFTSVAGTDGILQQSNTIPFTDTSFANNVNAVYLGLASANNNTPADIVNYIRGVESPDSRSRTADFNGDGNTTPWLLGDVISSSPILDAGVSPLQRYDSIYRDSTFTDFLVRYKDARQMVYFGANDGMIRGVNAGFYDKSSGSYVTSSNNEVAHPLGAEMWAYVPNSVLPHLQWLKKKDYKHNYYVDGVPQLHTVNIFKDMNDNDTYPNGWGKILVIGTGFGGGQFSLDTNGDGQIDTDEGTRPSFVVLDVTNPEKPPRLLAEISHPDMGFTTSRPTLAFVRKPKDDRNYKDPDRNEWYLVMGSGPTGTTSATRSEAVKQGVSDQTAKVFAFDLIDKKWVNFSASSSKANYLELTEHNDAFTGALTSVDWDASPGNGYSTDAMYLGTVAGSVNKPTGEIYRLVPGANSAFAATSVRQLFTRNQTSLNEPVQGVPKVVSRQGEQWVFFGTGRFMGDRDLLSRSPMGFYGVREFPVVGNQRYLRSTSRLGQLVNVTNMATKYEPNKPGGDLINRRGRNITKADTRFSRHINVDQYQDNEALPFEALELLISKRRGWHRRFEVSSQRQVGRVDSINDGVFFTVYTPGFDPCKPSGQTDLVGVSYRAGISPAYSILGGVESRGGVTAAANDSFLSSGLVKDVTLLGNITFNEATVINSVDNIPINGAGSNGVILNPRNQGSTPGANTPPNGGGNSSDPSGLPSPGAGGGSSPNSGSGSGSGGSQTGIECGKGFPIASSGNGGALGSVAVRNCRRLGGRLLWREVPLPW